VEPFKEKPLKGNIITRLLGMNRKYNFEIEVNNLLAKVSKPQDIKKEDIQTLMEKYKVDRFPGKNVVALPAFRRLFRRYLEYVFDKGEIQERAGDLAYLAELFELTLTDIKSMVEELVEENAESILANYLKRSPIPESVALHKEARKKKKIREIPETSACPYCGYELPTPKRKKKCPNCGNYMYVRTKHELPLDRILFTEQEVELVDFWSEQVCRISFVEDPNEIFKSLYKGDIKEAMIETLEVLKSKEVWVMTIDGEIVGKKPAYETVANLQHQLNTLLHSQTHKDTYKDSALQIKRESIRNRVLQMKKNGIKKVRIDAVGDRLTCPNCAKQDGKVYDIDTFLKEMPVPHPECSNEKFGCRCRVVAYFEDF